MPARRMRYFLSRYGTYRLHQMMEILADPTDPAPEKHIAEILEVSKSTVSKWVKVFIVWRPELVEDAAKEADYQANFEMYHAQKSKEHISALPRHRAAILKLTPVNEKDHRA